MDKKTKITVSRQVMRISGIFCLLVATLLLANFWHLKKSDPLESKTMEALVHRLAADPDNEELRKEIRNFDLLARKAYFTGSWQVKTGALMLLFGGIIFAIALKIHTDTQHKIDPPGGNRENAYEARSISYRWLMSAGFILIALALFAAYSSTDQLKNYLPAQLAETDTYSPEEEIEVISIVDSTSSGEADIPDDAALDESQPETGEVSENPPATEKAEKPEFTIYGADAYKTNQANFRGYLGHGISWHKNIPVEWDGASGQHVRWKVALSKPGYNSPVIWEDRIFVCGADQDGQLISCFDRNNGQLLWETEIKGIPGSPSVPPKVTDDTGLAAPTMATDGNHVYAVFATGDIVALNFEGKMTWGRNLGVPRNHYGHSSSLIVWKDKLVVQYDTGKGGRMLALNVIDGESLWDIQRDNQISWSSPILIEKEGKMQIVTTADPWVAGYDPEDGTELWKVDALMGEIGPSPAYSDGLVFATNEYARTVAIRPEAGSEIIWEDDYYMSEVSSPVAYNGLLFLATSYGDLVCHDALTGEMYWEQHFDNGFYSSPMIAEDKLYIIDIEGIMHILKADKSGEIINEPELGEKAYAVPAFSDGRIYIRSNTALYCMEN